MALRIFDHLLVNHTWSAAGRLCVPQQPQAVPCQPGSPKAERDALLARLVLRSRSDRVMCRAARRLAANPSMPLDELATELSVSEQYLKSGLRTVLGVDPQRLSSEGRGDRDGKLSVAKDTAPDAVEVAKGAKDSVGVTITDAVDGTIYRPEDVDELLRKA